MFTSLIIFITAFQIGNVEAESPSSEVTLPSNLESIPVLSEAMVESVDIDSLKPNKKPHIIKVDGKGEMIELREAIVQQVEVQGPEDRTDVPLPPEEKVKLERKRRRSEKFVGPRGDIKLTKATKFPIFSHSQSGWSGGAVTNQWIVYAGADQKNTRYTLYNIYTDDTLQGPVRTGAHFQLGPRGGFLQINPSTGEVWETDWLERVKIPICKFPETPHPNEESWVSWRFVPNAYMRMNRFIWVERRSPTNVWYAGCYDINTGKFDWRPASGWLPEDHVSRQHMFHAFHSDKHLAVCLSEVGVGEPGTWERRWYFHDVLTGKYLIDHIGSHPAMRSGYHADIHWNNQLNRGTIRSNFQDLIIHPRGEASSHLYVWPIFLPKPYKSPTYIAASIYARNLDDKTSTAWTQSYVDVFRNKDRILRVKATKQGKSFNANVRPFLGNMYDGMYVFWHSDAMNDPDKTDLYIRHVESVPYQRPPNRGGRFSLLIPKDGKIPIMVAKSSPDQQPDIRVLGPGNPVPEESNTKP